MYFDVDLCKERILLSVVRKRFGCLLHAFHKYYDVNVQDLKVYLQTF